jgi:hypothetical protein
MAYSEVLLYMNILLMIRLGQLVYSSHQTFLSIFCGKNVFKNLFFWQFGNTQYIIINYGHCRV